MFARNPELALPLAKKEEVMFAIKCLPIYAWLLTAVVVLALALMFVFDLPMVGWALLIVYLIGWAIREATKKTSGR